MLQRFNIKLLGVVFAVLLALVIVIQIANRKPERNFKTHLAQIDTTQIQKIEILNFEKEPIEFEKNAQDEWSVKQGEKAALADKEALNAVVLGISDLKVRKRVGAKKSQWKKYEVTDSLGTRLIVHSADDILADIVVGRFSYKQRGQGMDIATNARLYNDEETYTIDGQLSMLTRRDFNGFRNHTVCKVIPDRVSKIRYLYPADSSFMLENVAGKWNMQGKPIDSLSMSQYFNEIKNVSAHNFIESFDVGQNEVYKIIIENHSGQQYEIEAYRQDDKFVMRTSLNENAVFSESKRIFDRLFKSPSYFVKGS